MPITGMNRNAGDTYTAEEDVFETLEDGRTIQIIGKGMTIPMEEALRLGLLKPKAEVGPSESKPAAPPQEAKKGAKGKGGENIEQATEDAD